MKKFGFATIVLLGMVFLSAFPLSSFADTVEPVNSPAMKVAPVIEELSLDPSTKTDRTITVQNQGEQELSIKVYVTPYSVVNGTGASDFETQSDYTQMYHWIKIRGANSEYQQEAEFTIKAHETKNINYRVEVPESAPGGSQHACIFVETAPKETVAGSIPTVSRAAVKIFAVISGETVKDAEIITLNTDTIVVDGKVSATTAVKNIGNVDIKPTLTLKINTLGGETVFSDTQVAMIFPEHEADIKVTWPETPVFGIYNIVTSVNILGKNSIIEKTIFILPSWFIVLLLIIVAIVVIILLRNRRMRRLRARSSSKSKK